MAGGLADTLLWGGREQPSVPKEADAHHPELSGSSSHSASRPSASGQSACVSGPAFGGVCGKAFHVERQTLMLVSPLKAAKKTLQPACTRVSSSI